MPSIQERIVAKAQALILAAGTLAADRVYRSRTEAIKRDMTPAIVLRPDLETCERESAAVDRNQFELTVEIIAREDTVTGAAWDQVADLVKVAVHAVLMAEDAFEEADRVQRFYIDWIEDEGDNTAGNCMVRYRFTYLCNTGDLTAGPTFY
ncbi:MULTISPECIES: hypothetical protein [Pseudomonas]|uniref:DUF3168 domain-containing protein n=2 Tax=Pseudomonas TaxID=286 RepID=A0A1H1ILK6_9PSED|nr:MULTISPECIES: hypothetical protein [Pseudomonas]KAA8552336.1 hypothetical protein FX984_04847 [Pseudomonas marginalis]MCS4314441.1 crotonobetainyl-CoA:carnitine CoA-transferase CaiB-like acyl-CoA transferase [Pseudomonas sp. BIGb0381]QCG64268.1 hypothetical protein E4167_00120 [Pseudomonas veronii]TWR64427.1 hypothetical protein FIV39_19785 [Pseudomonas grimontii]SDR38544.1 hypothetical protein SAMN04490186_5877 [Pseudomonas grimontii]